MSILQEVLLEEYDRCRRIKKVFKDSLQEYPKGSASYKQRKKSIRIANKDMRMLRRALGPFVILKWRQWVKRENEYKLQMTAKTKDTEREG